MRARSPLTPEVRNDLGREGGTPAAAGYCRLHESSVSGGSSGVPLRTSYRRIYPIVDSPHLPPRYFASRGHRHYGEYCWVNIVGCISFRQTLHRREKFLVVALQRRMNCNQSRVKYHSKWRVINRYFISHRARIFENETSRRMCLWK